MVITHTQNRKMPRGTSGKVTIKENVNGRKVMVIMQARLSRASVSSIFATTWNNLVCAAQATVTMRNVIR